MLISPRGYCTQNCAKNSFENILRIPLRWFCSWFQLVFYLKTICSILLYCIIPAKNKLLTIIIIIIIIIIMIRWPMNSQDFLQISRSVGILWINSASCEHKILDHEVTDTFIMECKCKPYMTCTVYNSYNINTCLQQRKGLGKKTKLNLVLKIW